MEEFLATEKLIIELLLIVSVVAITVRRLRIPYTVALVVVGLLITFQESIAIDLSPEIILAVFVPPLIFEAAFHLEFQRLRENLLAILVLAVPGLLLSTVVVAAIVSLGVKLSFTTALVFGALISATDPVAVIALFRSIGAPKRLSVLVEGESLFNDGTAIVVYKLMIIAAVPALATESSPSTLIGAIANFVWVAAGGMGIGVGLGWIISKLIARLDDYLIETTLTTVLAFGAYLIAERFHVSGVLAVVGAGVICGNIGPRGMSPTTKIVLFNFWEYLAFIANSLVFLLIGLDVNIPELIEHFQPTLVALIAVLVARVLVVYGLTWLANLRVEPKVPLRYQHVLVWGGLRGAISLALALSLPAAFPERDLLLVMTFGVVLFTLLAQGTTMSPLLRWLGLVKKEEVTLEYERRHGRVMALQAARKRLEELYRSGTLSAGAWEELRPGIEQEINEQRQAQHALLQNNPRLRAEEIDDARREALRAQRVTLSTLLSAGIISEDVYSELVQEIDRSLLHDDHIQNLELEHPEAPLAQEA